MPRKKPRKISPAKAMEKRRRLSFKQRFLSALPFMLSAVLLTAFLSLTGSYRAFETSFTDTWMRFDMPDTESDVVIVDVRQKDFETFFEGQTRPLKVDKMQTLIDAIARSEPCLITVDFDTHFPEFKAFEVKSTWKPPVVWAREPVEIPEDTNQKLQVLDILGGQSAERTRDFSGVPLLIDDASDKVTRRYSRLLETETETVPSLAWASYQKLQQNPERCPPIKLARRDLEATTDQLFIGFSRGAEGAGRIRIPASDVLEMSKKPDWANNELLKNKIVLLGGSYLGEDKHDTPLGTMDGMEILANVIETEIRGGGFKPLNGFGVFLLIALDGILIVLLFHFFPLKKAIVACLVVIPFLSFAGSFFAYGSLSRWLYFTPIMLFVLFNELKDVVKGYFKTRMIEDYKKAGGDEEN